jgi:glycosylphosphatidylinositol phospholipase D
MKHAGCGTVRARVSMSSIILWRAVRRALRRPRTALTMSVSALAAGLGGGSATHAESAFPPVIELASLYGGDGSTGFVLKGAAPNDHSGYSVSGAGDLNGDGIDDLLVGAPTADRNGNSWDGQAYVVFGRTSAFPPVFELLHLDPLNGGDGSTGFVLIWMDTRHAEIGFSVSGAGDMNGDGIDDVVVGAPGTYVSGRRYAGESYVVFGRTTGFPAAFKLKELSPGLGGDGSQGFILTGTDFMDRSGASVSGAGDVNGDGVDDLIIGAPQADPDRQDAGESYVVFGRTAGFPAVIALSSLDPNQGGDGGAGFILAGADPNDLSGASVSDAGDVNGDGTDDLLIGAYLADAGGETTSGKAYVVFGRATGFPARFELSSLDPALGGDGSEGFVLEGIHLADETGRSVSTAGDVNGDGIDDLIIGAPGALGYDGASFVVFGRSTAFPPAFDLNGLTPGAGGDGSSGFILRGVGDNNFAGVVSDAGDVNGDGIDDVLVAAPWGYPDGRARAGEGYVVFGRSTPFSPVLALSALMPAFGGDGGEGVILRGIRGGDYAGTSICRGGDVNGDGVGDVIMGAPRAMRTDERTGESYVVFGRAQVSP